MLIGIKCTVKVADNGSPILTTPQSKMCVFYETKVPIKDRGGQTPMYLTRQGIFMYFNLFFTAILAVLIPPQNMFKMFPQISVLENIAFVK